MRKSPIFALMMVLAVLLACKKRPPRPSIQAPPAPTTATTVDVAPPGADPGVASKGDLAAVQARLAKFLVPGADTSSLTLGFKPTSADYPAVFGPDAAEAQTYYAKMWSDPRAQIKPNAGQTQLLVFASTTDIVSKDRDFPGGYARVHLQKGLPIYRWKFVAPGKTYGMAFDGLVFVNGHFAFFPKPWRIADAKTGQ